MFCVQIHVPAILPNEEPMCFLNGSGRLRSLICFLFCYAAVSLSFPSQIRLAVLSSSYLQINTTGNEASFTLPSVVEKRLVQAWFVATFSFVYPAELCNIVNWYMTLWFFILAKTQTLCGCKQNILLLKGNKPELCLHEKMSMVHRFFHACLTFQFRSYTVTEGLQTRR